MRSRLPDSFGSFGFGTSLASGSGGTNLGRLAGRLAGFNEMNWDVNLAVGHCRVVNFLKKEP